MSSNIHTLSDLYPGGRLYRPSPEEETAQQVSLASQRVTESALRAADEAIQNLREMGTIHERTSSQMIALEKKVKAAIVRLQGEDADEIAKVVKTAETVRTIRLASVAALTAISGFCWYSQIFIQNKP